MLFKLALVSLFDHWIDVFTLIQTATFVVRHVALFREHLRRGVAGVEGFQHAHRVITRRQRRALLRPVLRQIAQVFQTLVVGRETARPEHAEQRQCRQCADVQRTLAPMDAAAFALVQTGQIGLGENHLAEQVMDEPRTTAAQGRQHTGVHAEAGADAGGGRIHFLSQVRCAGQVETTQLRGTLITVAGERHVDEQAQALADLPQLMREVEDAATALGVALGVHAHDHLAVEATQQFFELVAQHSHVGADLILAETGAEHLIAFFAGQLIEELVEAQQLVGLAQYQIHRHVDVQFLMNRLAGDHAPGAPGCRCLARCHRQGFHRNGHQHAVQRTTATTLAQQLQQGGPGTAVDFSSGLGHVTPGGVDQHTVVGEVPVAMTGAEGVAGQLAVDLVDREFQTGEIQQAGLAARPAGRSADTTASSLRQRSLRPRYRLEVFRVFSASLKRAFNSFCSSSISSSRRMRSWPSSVSSTRLSCVHRRAS